MRSAEREIELELVSLIARLLLTEQPSGKEKAWVDIDFESRLVLIYKAKAA